MSGYLLGADLGTTGLKTAIFDVEGNLIASATAEYPTFHSGIGLAEQNPEHWWDALKQRSVQLFHKPEFSQLPFGRFGISFQSSTVLPLDKNGHPLRSAMIWMDSRGDAQRTFMKNVFATIAEVINRIR